MLIHQILFDEVTIKTHFNVWKTLFQVLILSLYDPKNADTKSMEKTWNDETGRYGLKL